MDDLMGALSSQSKGFKDTKDIHGQKKRTAEEKKQVQQKVASKVGGTIKNTQTVCSKCKKEVFVAEKIEVEIGESTVIYHKACFRCFQCDKKLDITNWTSHTKNICCKVCSKNLLKQDTNKMAESVFISPLHQTDPRASEQQREQMVLSYDSDEEKKGNQKAVGGGTSDPQTLSSKGSASISEATQTQLSEDEQKDLERKKKREDREKRRKEEERQMEEERERRKQEREERRKKILEE